MPHMRSRSHCTERPAAALAVSPERGIEALRSERLVDRAGIVMVDLTADNLTPALCGYEAYQAVAETVFTEFAEAFADDEDWRGALRVAARNTLRRMAARPDEARLYFVEVTRGDHGLLERHVAARARLVKLCVDELSRRGGEQDLPEIRVELLIGAGFRAIADAVEDGRLADLPELERELAQRAWAFEAVAA